MNSYPFTRVVALYTEPSWNLNSALSFRADIHYTTTHITICHMNFEINFSFYVLFIQLFFLSLSLELKDKIGNWQEFLTKSLFGAMTAPSYLLDKVSHASFFFFLLLWSYGKTLN